MSPETGAATPARQRDGAAGAGEAPRIALLDPLVADQIAAGEVIERPASVVKELVENALDAGAREIEIEIADGGRERVVVRDDGSGMHPDDAERACLRHATSKLRRLEDLAAISSHGFRGEALASIAAVAEVTITTRRASEEAGIRVVVREGAVRDRAPVGAPPGTAVEVRGLFAAIPARRKFLRSAATETSHVSELLQRIALVRPEIGIACRQGSRDVLRYPAVSRPEERLRQAIGAARARAMLPLDSEEGIIRVRGFVSRVGESFPQARSILTYVNGRLVRDRVLLRAISDAYRALLPQGRYPLAVLCVDLPGGLVDVNVHPTKSEVRFAHGDAVYAAVLRAVRGALAAGVQAPGATAAAAASADAPPAAASRVAEIAAPSDGAPGSRVAEALSRYASRLDGGAPVAAAPGGGFAQRAIASGAVAPRPAARAATPVAAGAPAPAIEAAASDAGARDLAAPAEPPAQAWPGAPVARFADLRVIGQAFGGYIVCEAPDALVLVDQHAAHERIRFERLRAADPAAGASGAPSQKLLVPRVVELEPTACLRLLEAQAELAHAGFDVEAFGDRSLLVRAIPAALDVATDADVLLADLAADLADADGSERLAAARDALLARIACHGSVRAGQALPREAMQRIVADLDTIPFAATCPHGRPLLAELPRAEIARRVRRV